MKTLKQISLILFPYLIGIIGYMCLRDGLYWLAALLFVMAATGWLLSISEHINKVTY